ncbi:MAG: hypothetical protein A2W52_02185 [Candidatus Taylorbacteria bacterium RIFCSPHIGHO2_02_49_25]|uniref:Uncharacterized protein n=1 Tax=Candidatus Taylorbacteria bacterium RIFCSPHIGHO2_02_49_25 TaxID=1802305 RepID=A0A1G2MF08_9BACT|nr:MAG: hypothetical protein UY62_C0021G0014 [Parcubacteria group bacterium GW2011_GWF2_50_9]OHA19929.1 MAG: hypothetical protein A2759_04100 [Candidatus Taylorbacteria bacterium RIFCSPHIGHO2_01_FULL_49_60]OHA21749.1 MAG: hypothetical protein A2W52_02185 [Candidatus Taylorbacteria bacterium RIFCSPHIGHO2_02_49_25]OHA35447.1 MAG: hypothetical protein A2W65_00300 [Candidatus Taylorbacteria bacterium RIFCSPLOWO2_02_50_13]OHA36188.1 MAG: hypothetical protein A3B27_03260 [Candidatus Taylorbacteria ba
MKQLKVQWSNDAVHKVPIRKENSAEGLVQYRGELWWIKLTGNNRLVEVIQHDGTRRNVEMCWGYFLEIMYSGRVINEALPSREELTALRASA